MYVSPTQNSKSLRNAIIGVSSLLALALTGCGAGSKVVNNVTFGNTVQNGDLYASMDATLAPNGLILPAVTLPLFNPKNPSQVLGSIETNGLHIIVNVNATAALKLPGLVDGTKLPGGSLLPLALPVGLTPIGIPAFNSNSVVYVAVSGSQVMLGVAVSIAKQDSLKLPISIFLPFTISSQITGTAGFYLGEKQGVAVFAMKEATPSVLAAAAGSPESMSMSSISSLAASKSVSLRQSSPGISSGRISVTSEAISKSDVKRLDKTFKGLRSVNID
ncbi:MAG: hypothetical protein H7301_14500 [Cryobacterium sp.]|nr:hypothetical protein [Oligoflexia bacterium]